jgi:hypothetical protein
MLACFSCTAVSVPIIRLEMDIICIHTDDGAYVIGSRINVRNIGAFWCIIGPVTNLKILAVFCPIILFH